MAGMNHILSRKLLISEESGEIYKKANEFFDKLQNEITILLAQKYLEIGKLEIKETVCKFLKDSGASGYNVLTSEISTAIIPTEDSEFFVFPCSFEIDDKCIVAQFLVQKFEESKDKKLNIPSPIDPLLDKRINHDKKSNDPK